MKSHNHSTMRVGKHSAMRVNFTQASPFLGISLIMPQHENFATPQEL